MRRHFLLVCQLGILGILVVWNNVLGLDPYFNFYDRVWGWDIVSHILGGLWFGLCAAWVASLYGKRVSILTCVLCAFGIGIAWEIFELVTGMGASTFMSYTVDTIKDLIDDSIGGYIAGYFVNRFRR